MTMVLPFQRASVRFPPVCEVLMEGVRCERLAGFRTLCACPGGHDFVTLVCEPHLRQLQTEPGLCRRHGEGTTLVVFETLKKGS